MNANGHIFEIETNRRFWVQMANDGNYVGEEIEYDSTALPEKDIRLGQYVFVEEDASITAIHFPPYTQEEIDAGEKRAKAFGERMGWAPA